MEFALVEGRRSSARKGLEGTCPRCQEPVIAKCGPMRVWHWAHRGKRNCDAWWEPETAWHRAWKDHFHKEFREVIHRAPDGEKHFADIRTAQGLIIELQHSFLKHQERISREAFYRNMVWVVDGVRRKRDRKRFFDAIAAWWRLNQHVFVTSFVEEGLPKEWLESRVPVYFDFGDGNEPDDPFTIVAPMVWCLLPKRVNGYAVVVAVQKVALIDAYRNDREVFSADKLIRAIEEVFRRWHRTTYMSHYMSQRRLRLKPYFKKAYSKKRPRRWIRRL
jgi:hypothetical protein